MEQNQGLSDMQSNPGDIKRACTSWIWGPEQSSKFGFGCWTAAPQTPVGRCWRTLQGVSMFEFWAPPKPSSSPQRGAAAHWSSPILVSHVRASIYSWHRYLPPTGRISLNSCSSEIIAWLFSPPSAHCCFSLQWLEDAEMERSRWI